MYKYFFLVCVQMYAAVNKELCEKMMNELEGMLSLQFEMNNTPLKWRNTNNLQQTVTYLC